MTGTEIGRGEKIRRRRIDLGINSAAALADQIGMDKKTVSAAERGEASENSYLRIESWLSHRETGDNPRGEEAAISVADDEEVPESETIRVNVTGPHAEWKVSVQGPRGDGDELSRIAADLAHRLKGDAPP